MLNTVKTLKFWRQLSCSVQKKLPLLTMFIHMMIVNIFFQECSGSDNDNDYAFGTKTNKMIGFLIYYPILCVSCFIWNYMVAMHHYDKEYSYITYRSRRLMSFASAVTSFTTFTCGSYYFEFGQPFKSLFSYYKSLRIFLICYAFVLITCFSIFEILIWSVRKSDLPLYVGDSHIYEAQFLQNYNDPVGEQTLRVTPFIDDLINVTET